MPIIEVNAIQQTSGIYAACGIIFTTWADGTRTQGTCVLVGRNDILTAGHVIYDPDRGGWAKDIDLYFGADYNNITDRFDSNNFSYSLTSNFKWNVNSWPNQIFSDSNNNSNTSTEAQYDIALIGVSEAVGDKVGWLGISGDRDYTQTVTQIGYPSNSTGMMTSIITVDSDKTYSLYHSSMDIMGPGSSGGPLITSDGYVIGIKSTSSTSRATWADVGFVSSHLNQSLIDNDYLMSSNALPYSTIDYLPDLTTSEISNARKLNFKQISSVYWDYSASVYGSNENALTHGIYSFYAIKGATYDIYSLSYFDPYVLRIFDKHGNVISANDEADDGKDLTLIGVDYSQDIIYDWVAPYTGTYYVQASWNQGNFYKFYALDIYEDIDTIKPITTTPNTTTNTIKGTLGNDTLNGTIANDLIYGDFGNDIIIGGAGNDFLHGGDGMDTVKYSGLYTNFIISALYTGKNGAFSGYQIVDKNSSEGRDIISTDVEYLTFNNNLTKISLGLDGKTTIVFDNTINLSPTEQFIIFANIALNSLAISSNDFNLASTKAANLGLRNYANSVVSGEQSGMTEKSFTTLIFENLGLTPSAIGQASYDALIGGVGAYINSVGVENRGIVCVQLAMALVSLPNDVTFGTVAVNLSKAAADALAYSKNPLNTVPKYLFTMSKTALNASSPVLNFDSVMNNSNGISNLDLTSDASSIEISAKLNSTTSDYSLTNIVDLVDYQSSDIELLGIPSQTDY